MCVYAHQTSMSEGDKGKHSREWHMTPNMYISDILILHVIKW